MVSLYLGNPYTAFPGLLEAVLSLIDYDAMLSRNETQSYYSPRQVTPVIPLAAYCLGFCLWVSVSDGGHKCAPYFLRLEDMDDL